MENKENKQPEKNTGKEQHPGTLSIVTKSRSEEAVASSANRGLKHEKDVRFATTPVEIPNRIIDKDSTKTKESKPLKTNTQESYDFKGGSPKVSRKYFTNWKQACDKTKDRTRELLKRWRTLPETDLPEDQEILNDPVEDKSSKGHGWSVHVWTTWVNRYSVDGCDGDSQEGDDEDLPPTLSALQTEKMTLFFTELLDTDRDDLISEQDFQHFCEKLAHFADWSFNSPEYHILLEVKNEFVESFIDPLPTQYGEKVYWRRLSSRLPTGFVDLKNWLARWPLYVPSCSRFQRLPLFLQYFCKILFGVINKSGSGKITRQEMKAFYVSVIGMNSTRCDEVMDTAFSLLTSNDHLDLDFETYKRCYCNWLCGKNPNGAGQWILVPPVGPLSREPYPVDYSALNGDSGRLEKYGENSSTTRHSVVV